MMHKAFNAISLRLYSFLGVYVLLYSPILKVGGFGLIKPLALCGLTIITARSLGHRSTVVYVGYRNTVLLISLVALTLLAQLTALVQGNDTTLWALALSLVFGVMPLSYCVVSSLSAREGRISQLVRLTAMAGSVQSVFILIDWLSPSIRSVFSSVVIQPESLASGFRAAGLSSMTGDGLSFAQSLTAISAYALLTGSVGWIRRLIWTACFGLILVTMVFVGRTGFVVILVYIAFSIAFARNKGWSIVGGIAAIILPFTVALGGVFLMPGEQAELLVDHVLPHAFEMFFRAMEGNGFGTDSTDALATSHLVFPESGLTWLFGDGYFSDPLQEGVNYKGTDIGYLRILFYVGLSGSMSIYIWFLAVLYVGMRIVENTHDRRIYSGFFLCFFVANMKFPFMLMGVVFGFAMMLLFAASQDRQYENNAYN